LLEEYNDGTHQNFLLSVVRLADLETHKLEDGASSIRLTIGWKNPQENSYDFSGINIAYKKDPKNMVYTCTDGYGFGSATTLDLFYPDGKNTDGKWNTTVREWRDFVDAHPTTGIPHRIRELQDCEIVGKGTNATERPDFGDNAVPGILPN